MFKHIIDTRKKDRGIFDLLLSWSESLRAKNLYPFGLEEQITTLECIIQDVNDRQIQELAVNKLTFWYELFHKVGSLKEPEEDESVTTKSNINAFQDNLYAMIHILILWANPKDSKEIIDKLSKIEPNPPKDWKPSIVLNDKNSLFSYMGKSILQENKHSITKLQNAVEMLTNKMKVETVSNAKDALRKYLSYTEDIDTDNTNNIYIRKNKKEHTNDTQPRSKPAYIWNIDLRFPDNNNPSAISYCIWTLATSLQQINGVTVIIDSWGTGSLWVKLKILISNIWARDEVKEVIEKSRDAVIADCLDKRIEQVRKLESERVKIDEEIVSLKKKRDLMPSKKEAASSRKREKKLQELEIDDKVLDVQRKYIENSIKSLEFMEKASDLIKDGIIKTDRVEIDINKLFFLSIDSEIVRRGMNINEILKSEKKLSDDQDAGTKKK